MGVAESSHEKWMQLALSEAQMAANIGEVPVGAVVVSHGELIASRHNQPILECDPSAHAEILALRSAAEKLENYRLVDCDIYVTLEPCMMCLGAMIHARIQNLYFAAFDPKSGVTGTAMSLHELPFLNHKINVTGGILENESASLLKSFFKSRR